MTRKPPSLVRILIYRMWAIVWWKCLIDSWYFNHKTRVDYEQSLFFLGPSSKTPETRELSRAWLKARRAAALFSRVSRLRRVHSPSLLNLKKKRDCSQFKTRVKLERKTSIITTLDEQNIVIVMQTGFFLYHLRAPDMGNLKKPCFFF